MKPERPLRVVLVDDDADVLLMLEVMLTKRNLDVVGLASCGADAEKVTKAIGPDIAIVDYMMPGMDGFETAARIKAACPDCVVVIYSALPDLAATALARADVDHFVAKGDFSELDAMLTKMRAMGHAAPG
ncbi:MAG: response regulator [Acidimicrobiia bacterium]|nr:response regulator [Acidimicrobiia bacterium]